MKSLRLERFLMLGLLGLLGLPPVLAQAAPPLEAFFARPVMQAARLSPDGTQLAFLATRSGGRQALFVLPLQPAEAKPRQLAEFDDVDVVRADWVGNALLVFQLGDFRATSGAHYREGAGLYSVDLEGGRPRELVQRRSFRAVESRGGRRQPGLDARHQVLALPREAGEELLIGRWDERGLSPLWLNARSGVTRDANIELPRDAYNPIRWWFDSRGLPLAVLSSQDGRNRIHWRGPDDAGWRLISERDAIESPFDIAFADDRGTLFVLQARGAAGEQVLTRFDFENGQPAPEPLAALPGFDLSAQPLWQDGAMVGLRLEGEREQTVWLLPAMQALQQFADERLPGRVNRLDCRRCGEPDGVTLLTSHSDRDPGQVWLIEEGGKRWRALARANPGIDPTAMAGLRLERIVARDGRTLPVWITEPALPQDAKPAVVLVHGGPWVRGTHWRFDPMAQFLASRGYLVIEPEFRGSTGYGRAHWKAGFGEWGRAMQDDVLDSLRWARSKGLANDKACVMGGSYGGYAALMGLARQAEAFRCGVAYAAVADLELLLGGAWFVDDDTSPQSRRIGLPRLIGDLKTERERIQQVSPVKLAAAIASRPLLLAHGDQDRRVPLAHAERLREALKAAGGTPEWVIYAGEAHGWQLQKNVEDFARRVEAFLAAHLR